MIQSKISCESAGYFCEFARRDTGRDKKFLSCTERNKTVCCYKLSDEIDVYSFQWAIATQPHTQGRFQEGELAWARGKEESAVSLSFGCRQHLDLSFPNALFLVLTSQKEWNIETCLHSSCLEVLVCSEYIIEISTCHYHFQWDYKRESRTEGRVEGIER